jgi:Outer membrane protein beta-barrel domain
MVKISAVFLLVLLCALPVMAQEEFPRIQTSLGYANLNFLDYGHINPDFTITQTAHHSGFANETDFNFTKNWGVSNYMGIYGLGGGVTLISDIIGGKAMYRTARVVPYGTAGIGFGYSTAQTCYSYYGCGGSFGLRYGGGVDVPINDSLAWKFELTRMSFHLQTLPGASATWNSGANFQTGIVITLAQ